MFRFFRAIRREFLEQGGLTRYADYAPGEIVLVVAGPGRQIEGELADRIE